MRIYSKSTLRKFWELHPNAVHQLEAWYKRVSKAEWRNTADVKDAYQSASIIANNRVVFNIKGNSYRLITEIHYNTQRVYVRFVGTHSEYDKVDATTI